MAHMSEIKRSPRGDRPNMGRRSPEIDRPNMSDLRIVLLGKNVSENSRVGNFLLESAAFDSEAPPDVVERVGGRLKDRHVMVINSPQLLQTNISDHQITQTVRECVYLSDPGPHVFILVLQHNNFTEEDMTRVKYVMKQFSEEAIKRTIVVMTEERDRSIICSVMIITSEIQQLIMECGGGSLQLDERKPEWQSEILKRVDKILEENKKECLTCVRDEDVEGTSVAAEQKQKENEKRLYHKDDGKPKDSDEVSTNVSGKQKLNLVLCGSDGTLTVSVSKHFQGKTISSSHQELNSGECVRRHVELHGHQISLMELPALSRLSEEEVMRQTLRCVSLCDPGVHVFLLIVPAATLNNDERAEIEKIQKIFDSREHFILLFTSDISVEEPLKDLVKSSTESQKLISLCGGQYRVIGLNEPENSRQIPELLEYIETMKTEPYSLQMYVKAQENRVRRDTEERLNKVKELKQRDQSEVSDLTPLRIVLLGKSMSDNSRVGNLIFGQDMFDSEAPQDVVETARGRLKNRHVMVINSPQLLQTNISDHQITQTVRECVILSDPGPHVFILVLQHNDFTEEDMRRVKYVLKQFSEEAIKWTIILTTDEETHYTKEAPEKVYELIQKLTTECGGGHLQLQNEIEEGCSIILQRMEKILRENSEEFLTCEIFDDAEETLEDQSRSFTSVETEKDSDVDCPQKKEAKGLGMFPTYFNFSGSNKKESPEHVQLKRSVIATGEQKLNLVLCGSDETLKNTASKLIREKKDMELHGCPISLVKLPALSRLAEEEVMRQTLHCLSLCDPGVHVFLLIIPVGPFNNEDKAEIEEIHKILSSRMKNYLMVLIIHEKNVNSKLSKINLFYSSYMDTSLQTFGCHCFALENSSQVPALLKDVENMVQENKRSLYTTFMYLQDRVELERNKHRAEIEQLKRSMMKTQSAAGIAHDDDLRIVLLGKTGDGKSATGNTILRREAFTSKLTSCSVTRECQKETSEFSRRQITVIDTPGLFDTGVDNDETWKEIVKCISMAAPGPHVFLLVIQLGRFTQEEKDAVKMIQETFGDKSRMYTMVLFTRGDGLGETTIEDFIDGDDSLQYIIHQCGKRYHVFNNMETKDRKQVSELLDKIDCMLTVNGGSFYTNEMFQQAEKNIKEEQERIMKEKEEEIKRKEEELKTKYEAEIEQMKKENEIERQEMQNELRKSEEEFKKKEEEIKKEKDENLQKELQRKLEEQQKLFEEENKRKEKALGEQQENLIKYVEEKHEKEKQKLQEKIQNETRLQAEYEYHEKLKKEVAKALEKAEEKHEMEKAKVLQEAEEKYETEKAKILQEAEEKYEREKAKVLQEAATKHEKEKRKVLQEAEEKYNSENAKALQEAKENYKSEKAKALQEAEEKYNSENAKALQEAEEKYNSENAKALQEAEEKYNSENAKALQEAKEKYNSEKAKALQEAEEKYNSENAKALQEAEEKYEREKAKVLQEAATKHEKEKRKALQEAKEIYKSEKAKALQEAKEIYKSEKAKALQEAKEIYKSEKAKALQEAEEKLPYSAKLARDWDQSIPFIGGAAGGLVGSIQDSFYGKKS